MRANLVFILGLIAVSCVIATQTSFQSELASNAEFRAQVESLKAQDNMGSVIVNLAELATEGRFAALFDAIDSLSKFLVKDRAAENNLYKLATAHHHLEVARLTKAKKTAHGLWLAARNLLKNKLYGRRAGLQRLILGLQKQLAGLKINLRNLREHRQAQIAAYKLRGAILLGGINALKKALPILQGLLNGQSFAELDADLFAQVSSDLKGSLSKLDMGELYTVFVESMITSLNNKNFVDQSQLLKVVKLIQNLLARLQKGLATLDANEALNAKNFAKNQASLLAAIKQIGQLLLANQARLVRLNARIKRVEQQKKNQWAIYQHNINSLILEHKNFVARTNEHRQILHDIDAEEAVIASAVRVLTKGGVTRSS